LTGRPLLSFIVLSYNYEIYIAQALRSILDQPVQDFEVIVVDDASTDASRDVIAGFGDPRIRLLVNERNLGGAASYNRAVSAAAGEWLVNVDADDWIAPNKSEAQLRLLADDPALDIIGTHISVVDANGDPHPRREEMEAYVNRGPDLNCIDSWIGRNGLCRSSTMVRRAAHLRIGLDDPTMARAPDYELWTRALRHGCRFALLPEKLTFYRLHSGGVTYRDPLGTFLEMSYAMLRNLIPLIEAGALWPSLDRMMVWMDEQEELATLAPGERYRLFGSAVLPLVAPDFAGFVAGLRSTDDGAALATAGRRCLALLRANPLRPAVERLEHDNQAFMAARDWWHQQSDHWQQQSDYWQQQSGNWQARAMLPATRGNLLWTPAALARSALSRFFRSS
jgi:GT2 family glycosyltransferase